MELTPDDKKKIQNYYISCLSAFGNNSPSSLSWSSKQAQEIRFKILCEVGDLNDKSVLDVGCGIGDLYGYLKDNKIKVNYLGIDLVPELIKAARGKYPPAKFGAKDIFSFSDNSFDYVIASGILSFCIPDYREKYLALISKMFAVSKIALVFNMLSKNGPAKGDLLITWDCHEIEKFCQTLTPNVKIIKGYTDDDFTIFLYH